MRFRVEKGVQAVKKLTYILMEMLSLISKHKLYFISPVLIVLAILALLVYYIGPTAIITFLYAGI